MKLLWKKLNRHGGFSLSELLTVILLLSVLMVGVTVVISSGVRTYNDSLYLAEVSSVENMINKALAKELRYSLVNSLVDGRVKEVKIENVPYSIELNEGGYLVKKDIVSGESVYLMSIGSYAGYHVKNFSISYQDKVYTCNYSLENKNETKSRDYSYTVRTVTFIRDNWEPGQDMPKPTDYPTPPPPEGLYCVLTIHYSFPDTSEDTYRGVFTKGSHYSIASPEFPGYKADSPIVEGFLNTDLEVNVKYDLEKYKINYITDPTPHNPEIHSTLSAGAKTEYTIEDEDIIFKKDDGTYAVSCSRDGFTFNGWFSDPTYTTEVRKISQGSYSDVTLYANLIPKTYKITFHPENGDSASEESHICEESISKPSPDPVNEGFIFDGWYEKNKSGSLSSEPFYGDTTYMPAKNVDLYAKWVADERTVTFVCNNCPIADINVTVPYGNTVSVPTQIDNPYHYNNGNSHRIYNGKWYKPDNTEFDFNTPITEDIVLHSDWDVAYKVLIQGAYTEFDYSYSLYGQTISDSASWKDNNSGSKPAFYVSSGTEINAVNIKYHQNGWNWYHGSRLNGSQFGYLDQDNYSYTINSSSIKDNQTVIQIGCQKLSIPCISEGTLITLADGSVKPVEKITAKDQVLAFNHETGKLDSSTMALMVHNGNSAELRRVMYLVFSDGTELKVVADHGLFDLVSRKYVYIDESNCYDYIGHEFLKEKYEDGEFKAESVKLADVYFTEETIRYFAPITKYHLNYFSNDMLSMTSLMDGLFNIFELDEDLKYDEQLMQEDIEKYGLFSYEDYIPYGVYPELYDYFPSQYFSVSIGKGMITMDHIFELANEYFTEENFLKE